MGDREKQDLIARAEAVCAELERGLERTPTGIEVVDMTKYGSSLKKIAELAERVVAARSLPNLYRRPAGRN